MILMSSVLKNSLLGQYFKSQFFDLWRELALKQRKRYIKNGKLLCNIKIILFVKNDWQNGFYEIKDNEIVTSYRTLGVEETEMVFLWPNMKILNRVTYMTY